MSVAQFVILVREAGDSHEQAKRTMQLGTEILQPSYRHEVTAHAHTNIRGQ